MRITRSRIATFVLFTFIAQMLFGCSDFITSDPNVTLTPGLPTPELVNIEPQNPDYAFAQATMEAGQSQLLDLSLKATQVSMDMAQAADAAAQLTQEYSQRQKTELDYQSTLISQNIAMAAATQEFLTGQTQIALDAAAAAQSIADAATQSAYLVNVTQTAHAQEIVNVQVQQTAQAVAALTAYPLTATPYAVTQAALLMQQYDREQQSFEEKIVAPLIPVFVILDILLIMLGLFLAFRRFMLIPWSYRPRISRLKVNHNPLTLIDGLIVDHDPRLHRRIPSELAPDHLTKQTVENGEYGTQQE
jgi:hypothetical protein